MADKEISITFMNTHKGWGGGEKWHFEAASFFYDLGYDVTFICGKGSVLEEKLSEKGIFCQHFKVSNLSFLNPFKIYLLKSLLQKAAVLIVNSPADNKLSGMTSIFLKNLKIIFRRGMPHPIKPSFINRWIFRHCIYRVIANSETVRASLNKLDKNLIKDENIVVIYNGFDIEEYKQRQYAEPPFKKNGVPTLVSCGRLVDQKNHLILLKAAKILNEKKESFRIVIVGDGPLHTDLKQYIVENNLSDKCYLLGFMENIKDILSCASVFLLPSFYEGSSNALIEACGSGLPAIVSDIPSNQEIVSNNVNGFLLPVDNAAKWAESISELIHDNNKLKKFSLNSQDKIEKDFSMKENREKLKKLIDSIADN
jgi:glycosyltransferase involved in cell wall biosynthesis